MDTITINIMLPDLDLIPIFFSVIVVLLGIMALKYLLPIP